FHLKSIVKLPPTHIFAGRFLQPGDRRLQKFIMLVKTLHPVGYPTGARLHEGDLEAWKTLEKPANDDAQNGDHLLEGMGHGMGVKRMIETLGSRGHAVARTYVNTDGHVEALRLG